jgi:lipoprotein-anchoring transpeptidase ErfK/SrfK
MRLTVFVVLLSSLAFSQNAGQVQAAQEKAQHAEASAQQSVQAAPILNARVTPTPRFSPKPGTFPGSLPAVTITDDTKGAVIYFTTDGSTPTPNSQRYTGPISLSATTTLKAIAIAPSFEQSRTARGKYVVK